MILYLSGNFPQFRTEGKEAAFRTKLHKQGSPYHRLCTYFYPRDCFTIFKILSSDCKINARLVEESALRSSSIADKTSTINQSRRTRRPHESK